MKKKKIKAPTFDPVSFHNVWRWGRRSINYRYHSFYIYKAFRCLEVKKKKLPRNLNWNLEVGEFRSEIGPPRGGPGPQAINLNLLYDIYKTLKKLKQGISMSVK
jgi:hypothetical protein